MSPVRPTGTAADALSGVLGAVCANAALGLEDVAALRAVARPLRDAVDELALIPGFHAAHEELTAMDAMDAMDGMDGMDVDELEAPNFMLAPFVIVYPWPSPHAHGVRRYSGGDGRIGRVGQVAGEDGNV